MVLAGAGGVAHEDLCKLATEHFGKISNVYESEIPKDVPCRYTGRATFWQTSLTNVRSLISIARLVLILSDYDV